MAKEQLAVAAHEVIASLEDEGICGLATHPVVEVIQVLHKSTTNAALTTQLIQSLHGAAEALICGTEHPTLTSLMVLFTLAKDIESGGAQPPADHPHAASWNALVPKLRMGLVSALAVYPVKGSQEGKTKQDLLTAAGALAVMLFPKTKQLGQPLLQLACEAAMFRLVEQSPGCLEYMRGADGFLLHKLRDAVAKAPEQVTLSLQELQELEEGDDCGEDEEDEEEEEEGEGEEEEQEEEGGDADDGEAAAAEEQQQQQASARTAGKGAQKRPQTAGHATTGKKRK